MRQYGAEDAEVGGRLVRGTLVNTQQRVEGAFLIRGPPLHTPRTHLPHTAAPPRAAAARTRNLAKCSELRKCGGALGVTVSRAVVLCVWPVDVHNGIYRGKSETACGCTTEVKLFMEFTGYCQ